MKSIADALDKLSPEVRAELAKPVEIRDPRFAEIVEGLEPKWFVVEVYASLQHDIAAELAQHRFGIYVPVVDETIVRRGRRIDRRVPLISGYVFVFMWLNDRHVNWIRNTPGVVAILGWIRDGEVDRLRIEEASEQFDADGRHRVKERMLQKIQGKRVGSSRRKKYGRKKANAKAKRAA